MKLPNDLPIFCPLMVIMLLCTQKRAEGQSLATRLWQISDSWWGNIRSMPPPWMSKVLPKYLVLIAVHSMCQPGKPSLQGEGQRMMCSGAAFFHRAKSAGCRFSSCPSSSRVWEYNSSSTRPESLPYPKSRSNLGTSK